MVVDRSDEQFGLLRVGIHDEPSATSDNETTRRTVIVLARIVEAENEGFVHVAKASPGDRIADPIRLLVGNHGQMIGNPFTRFSSG